LIAEHGFNIDDFGYSLKFSASGKEVHRSERSC
jgi:hypothetical protein